MEHEDIYHRLRKEIDQRMPVGMPPSQDGSEIMLLKKLFTEEEARIAVHLSALPETLTKIHRRIKKAGLAYSAVELERMLDGMLKKGLIMGGSLFTKPHHYSLAQFAIGIYEFQVDRQDEEFVRHAKNYMEKTFISEFYRRDRPGQMRTIPVHESLENTPAVSTYNDILAIADTVSEPIVVMNCVCKQSMDIEHEPCRLSDRRDTCFLFGNFAQHILDNKVPSARVITRDEFISIIGDLSETGYILQPQNTKIPNFLCACCGCCCNILLGYKMHPRPADYFQSSYRAEVIPDNCSSCEACILGLPRKTGHEVKHKLRY